MSKDKNFTPTYIDGLPCVVRLLTGGPEPNVPNEWDTVMNTLEGKANLAYFTDIHSWCQDKTVPPEEYEPMGSMRVARCRGSLRHWSKADSMMRLDEIGYRPVLVPLDLETLQPDQERMNAMEDGDILSMGTLYIGNLPCEIPSNPTGKGDIPKYGTHFCKYSPVVPGPRISICSTRPEANMQIRWIKCGGILVSDRCLLTAVSWEDLNRNGLVFGYKD